MAHFEFPFSPVVGWAALASFVSFAATYAIARQLMGVMGSMWVHLAVDAVIPISLASIILYRGNWRSQRTGAKRVWSVLSLSSAIFAGVLVALGASVCVIWISSTTLPKAGVR